MPEKDFCMFPKFSRQTALPLSYFAPFLGDLEGSPDDQPGSIRRGDVCSQEWSDLEMKVQGRVVWDMEI